MCRHYWVENWKGEEYCETCGIHKADLGTRYKQQATPESRPTQDEIVREIRSHSLYRYAWDLAEQIAADYGIQVSVVFRNRRTSELKGLGNRRFQLTLGYGNLDWSAKYGFRDYKSMHHQLWGRDRLTGMRAAWAIVLHELAHNVQFDERGRRPYGIQHPPEWVQEVRTLKELYPMPAA